MKKAKIWISVFVHLLLYTTFGTCLSKVNPITDDAERISILKQNIPKDYKITLRHIPKEASGACWVELSVFHLEDSLKELAQKFGNVSSNRDNIAIYIQRLQDIRYKIANVNGIDLDSIMEEFQCHYVEVRWQTGYYFDYVKDFLSAVGSRAGNDEGCEPPLCPSTAVQPIAADPFSTEVPSCTGRMSGCNPRPEQQSLPKVVQKSLLSLLIIPLAAGLLCLAWKICRRRDRDVPDSNPENRDTLSAVEGAVHNEMLEERIRLSFEAV